VSFKRLNPAERRQNKSMRILVTGVTGFAGSWLAEALLAHGGQQLSGLSLSARWPDYCRHLAERIHLHPCDLARIADVEAILRQEQPEQIYHLAGYPHTGRSFREPEAAWAGNLSATRGLLEAVVRWGGKPRILAVSSGLIYGDPERPGEVFDENTPLRPSSPYATSKAAADLVSYQYTKSAGLDIVRARPFNHFGPRQAPDFAVASFARQLAEIRRGARPPVLETGDLSAERDLTDVRDVVSAYLRLMDKGEKGEAYNVASGSRRSMREVLDRLVSLSGLKVELRLRSDLLRPTEPHHMQVKIDKLRAATGWQPRFSLDQTLHDTLAYWSERE
jgi:GDP-4-dehydro-6-deoxy-D-mannose reductase